MPTSSQQEIVNSSNNARVLIKYFDTIDGEGNVVKKL
jgi:hypothetical protein